VSIVLNPYSRPDEWRAELAGLLPGETIHVWPELGDPNEVEFVVAWRIPRATLVDFTNLAAILSLGAGAEQWLIDGMPDVDIVRLSDPAMSNEMAAYALHWVIRFQREFPTHEQQQRAREWEPVDRTQADQFRVGLLGYGAIGARIGSAFADLGYPVNAWSRTGGDTPEVTHYAGADGLAAFLSNSDAVINALPSTPETIGLLNAGRFAEFANGSVLINMGRGTLLDEAALIESLDSGPLRAAVLDVTDPEPPAPESPLWAHPQVHLTPHVAGSTQVRTAAALVAANIDRMRIGEAPFPLLDRSRGY
jgi:glyoxylate/hydroxypyruvate reductase A